MVSHPLGDTAPARGCLHASRCNPDLLSSTAFYTSGYASAPVCSHPAPPDSQPAADGPCHHVQLPCSSHPLWLNSLFLSFITKGQDTNKPFTQLQGGRRAVGHWASPNHAELAGIYWQCRCIYCMQMYNTALQAPLTYTHVGKKQ